MNTLAERLDLCEDFGDVFELVKKSAERSLGQRRAGLMLYLARLPKHIGAFHTVGTNGIVMNRNTLDVVTHGARSLRKSTPTSTRSYSTNTCMLLATSKNEMSEN